MTNAERIRRKTENRIIQHLHALSDMLRVLNPAMPYPPEVRALREAAAQIMRKAHR